MTRFFRHKTGFKGTSAAIDFFAVKNGRTYAVMGDRKIKEYPHISLADCENFVATGSWVEIEKPVDAGGCQAYVIVGDSYYINASLLHTLGVADFIEFVETICDLECI